MEIPLELQEDRRHVVVADTKDIYSLAGKDEVDEEDEKEN
jgi:hypothetical protein